MGQWSFNHELHFSAPLQNVLHFRATLCHVSLSQNVIMHGVDYIGQVRPQRPVRDLVRTRPTHTSAEFFTKEVQQPWLLTNEN
jgi:hypothetical protein